MATVPRKQKNPFTIDTNDDYELGDVGSGRVGKVLIHLTKVSGYDGTITVKGRARVSPPGTPPAYVAIPYRKHHLNGVVADGTLVSTGITDTSIIEVEAGVEVLLSAASRTTGSMTVAVTKLQQ